MKEMLKKTKHSEQHYNPLSTQLIDKITHTVTKFDCRGLARVPKKRS